MSVPAEKRGHGWNYRLEISINPANPEPKRAPLTAYAVLVAKYLAQHPESADQMNPSLATAGNREKEYASD